MYIYIGYWSPLEHILFQSGVIWSLQYLQDVFASNSTCNRVTNKPTVDKAPFGSKYWRSKGIWSHVEGNIWHNNIHSNHAVQSRSHHTEHQHMGPSSQQRCIPASKTASRTASRYVFDCEGYCIYIYRQAQSTPLEIANWRWSNDFQTWRVLVAKITCSREHETQDYVSCRIHNWLNTLR